MNKKKRPSQPLTTEGIRLYAESNSDFSFEMATLRLLAGFQFSCEHSGTYQDAATGKAREFDIRAINYQGSFQSYFPVECKNISESSPLVIHTVPRPTEDAFNQTIVGKQMQVDSLFPIKSRGLGWRVIEVHGERTRYKANAPVGKHMDQVADLGDDEVGSIQKRDGGVFDKFSQALCSSVDLVARAVASIQNGGCLAAAVVPFVVVPDGRLWQIPYDDSGNLLGDPKPVSRISMLVRHLIKTATPFGQVEYTISHAEFVTLTGLSEALPAVKDSGFF